MFTVSILFYGDHPALARRCFESVVATADWSLIDAVRLGCNAVSPRTEAVLDQLIARVPVPVSVYRAADGSNVGKYPMMRRMFADLGPAPRVMWFDDDSYLRDRDPGWWSRTWAEAESCTLLGSVYTIRIAERQRAAIRDQPWYAGEPVSWTREDGGQVRVRFCTGGWWAADPAFLRAWDYPWPVLHHRGGDVMLGVLCAQRRAVMRHYNAGVAINADSAGRESRSPRRGLDTPPLWRDYDPARPPEPVAVPPIEVTLHPADPDRRGRRRQQSPCL